MFVYQKFKIFQVFINVEILFFSLFFKYLLVENDTKIFDTNVLR